MDLLQLNIWLFAGVVISWLTRKLVKEERRRFYKPVPVKDRDHKLR